MQETKSYLKLLIENELVCIWTVIYERILRRKTLIKLNKIKNSRKTLNFSNKSNKWCPHTYVAGSMLLFTSYYYLFRY